MDHQEPKTRTPLNIVARMKAKSGCEEKLYQALDAMVAPTRSEPGCVNYDLHRLASDPTVFVLYEGWQSEEDLSAHMQLPHFKSMEAEIAPWTENFEDGKPFRAEQMTMLSLRSD